MFPRAVILQRIKDFRAPAGFTVFKPKREANFIAYSHGVRVLKEGPATAGTTFY